MRPYNAADSKQAARNQRFAEILRQQELDDLCAVLSTREGRRFFIRLIESCGQYKSSFTGNSQTFALEGKRQVALDLINDIGCIGLGGLEGLSLKHLAEREYAENLLAIQTELEKSN